MPTLCKCIATLAKDSETERGLHLLPIALLTMDLHLQLILEYNNISSMPKYLYSCCKCLPFFLDNACCSGLHIN
ncbi:hypothetical protein B566_EDAN002169 [Ephemera danica]|nr:hypothetical protein B566_EDAN002169 [Ephemera danica]